MASPNTTGLMVVPTGETPQQPPESSIVQSQAQSADSLGAMEPWSAGDPSLRTASPSKEKLKEEVCALRQSLAATHHAAHTHVRNVAEDYKSRFERAAEEFQAEAKAAKPKHTSRTSQAKVSQATVPKPTFQKLKLPS